MNVRGLRLNKLLAKEIYNSLDSISLQNLHGINVFNSFSWIGFSREEFKNLLSLFSYLNDNHFFDCVSDEHTFVFNYSTDITEMDIVSVLENKKDVYFIDIESKNGPFEDEEELKRKMIIQIGKRK